MAATKLRPETDPVSTAALLVEATARQDADAALTTQIAGKASTSAVTTAVQAEAIQRSAQDQALATQVASKADLVDGLIPTSQIPALALINVYPATSDAEQIALDAQGGDICIRYDEPVATWVHNGGETGTMADWTDLPTPTAPVTSVNSQIGTIVLGAVDVGAVSASDLRLSPAAAGTASVRALGTGATEAAAGNDSRLSNKRVPVDGSVGDPQIDPAGISPAKVAGTAVVTGDPRLSNARTPTAHASSHATAGSDPIVPADLGIPSGWQYESGLLIPQWAGVFSAQASTAPGANASRIIRFVADRDYTLTLAALVSTTGDAASTGEVSIFNKALSSKLFSSGPVALLSGTGVWTAPLSGSLVRGTIYHCVVSTPSATAAFRGTSSQSDLMDIMGAAIGKRIVSTKAISSPHPSSITTPAAISTCPIVALRES